MARRVFFYDDEQVESRHALHIAYGPVRKMGLLQWPRPEWDLDERSVFAGTVVELPDGGLRLYYSGPAPEPGRKFGLAVAESPDGVQWQNRPLGQLEIDGHQTNRIIVEGMREVGSLT